MRSRLVRAAAGGLLLAGVAGCGSVSAGAGTAVADSTAGGAGAPAARTASSAQPGVAACPSVPPAAAVAGGLPDLTLPCLGAGDPVRLSALRGPLVLNVWASWCPPCRAELPALAAVAGQAAGQVSFLGVDVLDQPAAAADLERTVGVPYPSVVDATGGSRGPLRWVGPPVTYFVAADGTVASVHTGEISGSAQLRQLIRDHLGVQLP